MEAAVLHVTHRVGIVVSILLHSGLPLEGRLAAALEQEYAGFNPTSFRITVGRCWRLWPITRGALGFNPTSFRITVGSSTSLGRRTNRDWVSILLHSGLPLEG